MVKNILKMNLLIYGNSAIKVHCMSQQLNFGVKNVQTRSKQPRYLKISNLLKGFIMKSENIDQIAIALCKAQSEFKSIPKNSINPHFKNRYASLDAIIESVRPILFKNGLSIVQLPMTSEIEGHYLETMLIHVSGQWITSHTPLVMDKNNMQGMGSAITYARRYALGAILGVAPDEDDDGNHNAESLKKNSSTTSSSQITGTKMQGNNSISVQNGISYTTKASQHTHISAPQAGRLIAICKKNNWSSNQLMEYLGREYEIRDTTQITRADYDAICDFVERNDPIDTSIPVPTDEDYGKLQF